ncbi:MAG: hypothetical protein GY711_18670 [bacterium]|nr:hypothetical protein [bacterium]
MTKIAHLALVAAASPVLFAQDISNNDTGDGHRINGPNFDIELPRWQAQHGTNWRTHVDPTTAHLEMLYGGSAQPILTPQSDAEWFALARDYVGQSESMHGIPGGQLVNERVLFLPLGTGNGTDKMTVRLDQEVAGVPVENGRVNVLMNLAGELLSVHSTSAPNMAGASAQTAISGEDAAASAIAIFQDTQGLEATGSSTPELTFAQVVIDGERNAYLAWQMDVEHHHDDEVPTNFRYTVDANTGQLLRRDDNIHHFDVGGTINVNASPGTRPDMGSNPPTPLPADHVRITSSAGTINTDRDGNFNYPGVNGPLNLTVTFIGPWANVNNDAGTDYTVTFNNISGTNNTLLMNPSPSQFITGQANGMRHVGIARDFIRDTNPGDNTGDFLATTNVNQNSSCNAFFNGGSINFFRAGGGCNNTAYSTVVAHEWGHWMNVRYGTGNGSDGMGEGNADVFAMYIYDNPIVGEFFTTGGGFVRTGTNSRQFCGDNNPGCHGGVHANGEVWMGAAWKVRRNLNTALGDTLGDMTADQVFSGWMNSFNQTQIRSIIETQWLTLDDNDGNIGNGTPNYGEIDSAFREQGFPGIDLDFVVITNVTDLPDTTDETGPYFVNADISAVNAPPITATELFYSVNSGPFLSAPMIPLGGDSYQGIIPGTPSPADVRYYVSANDNGGNTETFPEDAPGDSLNFLVGVLETWFSTDFEEAGDGGWSAGGPGDNATTGIWVRGDPNGTAAQSENDHTSAPGVNCWFTGQAAPGASVGTNDVDGGTTTLLSPIFDMSTFTSPRISYWRWYSNDEGGAPNSDIFRIDLSNNGGSTWTAVETVGPTGNEASGGWFQHDFSVASVLPLTGNMRLRFRASDLGTGSIVEAAIDDVEGVDVISTCPAPVEYCGTTPNSAGTGAVMSFFGTQSISADDANLFVGGAPAFQFGLFLYGLNQTTLPVGDGTLCVDNTFYRIQPALQTDLLGQAVLQLDFANPPAPAAQINPGSTWNFQFWYRDPSGGPAGNNLSNALRIEFCD